MNCKKIFLINKKIKIFILKRGNFFLNENRGNKKW